MKIFENEVHEGTLVHALECLQVWLNKSPGREVPQAFIDWIPKAMALKSVTSNVRTAYFTCLLTGLLASSSSSKSNESAKVELFIFSCTWESRDFNRSGR